jgi:hypothetical protein
MALTSADLNDVYEFLGTIRRKWFLLGTSLKLKRDKLEDIRARCGTDNNTGLLEVLDLWLKTDRSWADLAKALDSAMVGEEELAEKGMIRSINSLSELQDCTIQPYAAVNCMPHCPPERKG